MRTNFKMMCTTTPEYEDEKGTFTQTGDLCYSCKQHQQPQKMYLTVNNKSKIFCLLCSVVLYVPWYPRSGVVLDCIDS